MMVSILELVLIVTTISLVMGIVYVSFTEIFVTEQNKKQVLVSNKKRKKR
ncbi:MULTISPECIES: hypothetical protein [Acidianus]|nr:MULTISPECIES: hypothetical protein [Acidianus]NON62459.1 hypothetical protein [Acidianus sp. RZ1]